MPNAAEALQEVGSEMLPLAVIGPETERRMSRTTLIELILELNPTTTRDWLNSFGDTELLAYYDHVSLTQLPRDGKNPWVRRGDVAGVARFSEAS